MQLPLLARRSRDLAPTEVLAAHEWRFDGLAARVDELKAHHEHRLDELLHALATGRPPDLVPALVVLPAVDAHRSSCRCAYPSHHWA